MDLLNLILVFAVVGFCLYLVITYVPMPAPMQQALVAVIVICLVVWVARVLLGGGPSLRLGP